jgi:hypothetical protein
MPPITPITPIHNAGLVLTAPLLPLLWAKLELTKDQQFVDEPAIQRAALLLDFLAHGDAQPIAPAGALNRLLCGMPLTTPMGKPLQISTTEREACEGMLMALIAHWKSLGNTSVAGLREAFLQRDGELVQGESGWQLTVQTKAFDVLLDQLPWSMSMCKFPWMPQTLQVQWR